MVGIFVPGCFELGVSVSSDGESLSKSPGGAEIEARAVCSLGVPGVGSEDGDASVIEVGAAVVLEVRATDVSFVDVIECSSVVVGGWIVLAEEECSTGGEVKVNSMFVVNVSVGVTVLREETREDVSRASDSGFGSLAQSTCAPDCSSIFVLSLMHLISRSMFDRRCSRRYPKWFFPG